MENGFLLNEVKQEGRIATNNHRAIWIIFLVSLGFLILISYQFFLRSTSVNAPLVVTTPLINKQSNVIKTKSYLGVEHMMISKPEEDSHNKSTGARVLHVIK